MGEDVKVEVAVSPGDWVLFRSRSSYDPISVNLKQATKVSPAQIRFEGGHPRICHRLDVVAAFADKARAEQVRDAIGGVAGEYRKRKRVIEDERSERIRASLAIANRVIERIIARTDAPEPSLPHTADTDQ